MKLHMLALMAVTALPALASANTTSVYTSTKVENCKTIRAASAEAGSYTGECAGVGGYKVHLVENDIRQSLDIITPDGNAQELNFGGFNGGFSTVGEKIEWRTVGGTPVALISRFIVNNAEDSARDVSYLMVSKIGKTASCVTDIVKPGAKQNEQARKLADLASKKACKKP
jgi:hypothetical protein